MGRLVSKKLLLTTVAIFLVAALAVVGTVQGSEALDAITYMVLAYLGAQGVYDAVPAMMGRRGALGVIPAPVITPVPAAAVAPAPTPHPTTPRPFLPPDPPPEDGPEPG